MKEDRNLTKFDLVYCDPPWKYHSDTTGTNHASKHYNLMSQEEINALPVKSLLKRPGAVLMWATGPRLNFAIQTLEEWGLRYRGVAFVWVKTRKDGKIINGQGVPPTFTKPTTEFVLLGTTRKAGRPIPLQKFNTPQVILAPRGKHSAKPEVFREHIEATFKPPYDKLEMFSRKPVPGWTSIGDGVNGEDILTSIQKLNGTYEP